MRRWKSKVQKIEKQDTKNEDKKESKSQDSTDQFTDDPVLNIEAIKHEIGHNWDVHF
ncbi:hypothetical protein ACQKNS_26685 [Peribacillus sp. NPDC094092]|uniref:hypothetical protein n=1 Tax=Peribacillus sp. NPDC094092 TaxID=3390611 RepID=UPI003D014A68